ncbi:MAG: SMP-30/gluconolactonase/LRE family protein [Caldilineaceae bacterium]|nr:SMP-30/gluconolactonase/LRE family protein [Caldilineaceae bacterium]
MRKLRYKVVALGSLAVILTLLMMTKLSAASATTNGFIVEYDIPGNALNLVVEAPGRVWFTLPESSAIGSLVVTSTVDFTFQQFNTPTANSQPYDLVYDASRSVIWFSELAGNRIGRLDMHSGSIQEYPIPTLSSEPTGIALGPDGTIWFTERAGNKLGNFNPNSAIFTEYALNIANAKPEDIVVQKNGEVWATGPNVHNIFGFIPASQAIFNVPTSDIFTGVIVEEPWNVMLDSSGVLWVTTRTGNRLGRFMPGTVTFWRWFAIPTVQSEPTGIAFSVMDGLWRIWFSAGGTGRVGQLTLRPTGEIVALRQYALPAAHSRPAGLAVDLQGHVWIAESNSQKIAEWTPPYFFFVYLSSIFANNQVS